MSQTESLKAAFITYLQAKQAAGIINVPNPGSNQVSPLSAHAQAGQPSNRGARATSADSEESRGFSEVGRRAFWIEDSSGV